jgi:hypothetical protein
MAPYVPKYVSPKQAAEDRARLRATLLWIAVSIPLACALLMFGYSDQAPAFLRSMTMSLDRALGYPILTLLGAIVSR